ncbi:MAG TPA: hypothetical protein VNY09_03850 [Candidatus Sulfotelmatobacter sp.]|jgi:hypothetical protein|nr:hypothetical protein [Candidatus Sulfotelmatobacter sp.]
MSDHRPFARRATLLCAILLAISSGARAQNTSAKKSPVTRRKIIGAASPKISLSPRFVPGESFRYDMEFETTNETSRTGFATDPQGPSSVVVNWNATVRIDVLAPEEGPPGGIRLRTTYEKSTASVRSDTFDPSAAEATAQYQQLEGKVVEFTLDSARKVVKVTGIEGIADSEKAAQAARDWISQLGAGAGAPVGGVSVGQTWSSEQPATALPIAGLVWRAESEYLGNESCHPPNPDVPPSPGGADAAASSNAAPDCAVILAKLSLVRPKSARETTPPELRESGVQSAGKWTGSAQSLVYVSLDSGMVVSATHTGAEEMDVTLTSSHNTSMRLRGTISTRSQVALVVGETEK